MKGSELQAGVPLLVLLPQAPEMLEVSPTRHFPAVFPINLTTSLGGVHTITYRWRSWGLGSLSDLFKVTELGF